MAGHPIDRQAQAAQFRQLHDSKPLVLPNAWDAASAVALEAIGCPAIATTSAGVAWSHGLADGEALAREEAVAAVARIARAVAVPVSADIEAGYGERPEDVAATVRAVVAAGAVGINLEDAPGDDDGPLVAIARQCARLRAARAAADERGIDLFINARTDVYLRAVGAPEGRLDEAVRRLNAYRAAGADCLFLPGVGDPATIARVAGALDGPLNIMVGPGSLPVAELARLGVARVSLGPAIAVGALTLIQRAGREALERGTYEALADARPYAELGALFRRETA